MLSARQRSKSVIFPSLDYDLPVDVIGAVVIVESAENTSTVLVIKSIDTIYKGDRLEMKKGQLIS